MTETWNRCVIINTGRETKSSSSYHALGALESDLLLAASVGILDSISTSILFKQARKIEGSGQPTRLSHIFILINIISRLTFTGRLPSDTQVRCPFCVLHLERNQRSPLKVPRESDRFYFAPDLARMTNFLPARRIAVYHLPGSCVVHLMQTDSSAGPVLLIYHPASLL